MDGSVRALGAGIPESVHSCEYLSTERLFSGKSGVVPAHPGLDFHLVDSAAAHSSDIQIPRFDGFINDAESPYALFFRQVFDRQHETCVTYTCFFGGKSQWANGVPFEDPDPLLNQFLKAGCYPVSVLICSGCYLRTSRFMTKGQAWIEGLLSVASSVLFIFIVKKHRNDPECTDDDTFFGDARRIHALATLRPFPDGGCVPFRVEQQADRFPIKE